MHIYEGRYLILQMLIQASMLTNGRANDVVESQPTNQQKNNNNKNQTKTPIKKATKTKTKLKPQNQDVHTP